MNKSFHKPQIGFMLLRQMVSKVDKLAPLVDFFQLPTDDYIGDQTVEDFELLGSLTKSYPIHLHSLDFSIGSADGVNLKSLESHKSVIREFEIETVSDHIGFSKARGLRTGTPILNPALNDENIQVLSQNVIFLKNELGKPFFIENNSHCINWPESTYTDAEFISAVASKADCGLLLDLPNMLADARNYNFSPYNFIDGLPSERIQMIHVAGGDWMDGFAEKKITGGHNKMVEQDVWRLLEYVLAKGNVQYIILERSRNIFYSEILQDLKMIKSIIN